VMQSTTIQLAVRGKPSAFDLSFNNEMCVVASPGCLTFFLLSGSGSPRHVIHYEQPQQIRRIRYQKLGHLAALRGGVVSLWDPSKSLRPLLGFVQSPGWITDLNWNLSNYNILATCSDSGGGISLWDARSPSYTTMQISAGQVTTSVDWCPSNPNLLAACSDSKSVSVWDIRMTIPNTSSGPSTGSKNGSFSTITSTSGEIISCHWTGNEEIMCGKPSGSFPSLVISKDDSSLEWWNISGTRNSANSTSTTTNQQNMTQNSYSSGDSICVAIQRDVDLDSKSLLVPAPHGNGIVVCKRDDSVVAAQSSDSTARNAKRIDGMIGSLKQVSPVDAMLNSSYLNPAGHKMDITLHGCPNRNRGLGVGLSLQNASTTPSEDVDHWLTKGQATTLASCTEAVLGLKWSGAGRLISPAHAGFDLLMLTESAALHVLRVPLSVLASDPNDDESGLFTSHSSTKTPSNLDVRSSDKSISSTPKYSLKKSLYATPGHADHQAHSVRQVAGYNTIPFRAAGGSDVEAPLTGSSSVSTGYESDPAKARAKVDLSSILQWEILGLEERLQAGFLRGLSVSTVDEQARQVTLEVNHVSVSMNIHSLCCLSCFIYP
jgi:hypothetical protein